MIKIASRVRITFVLFIFLLTAGQFTSCERVLAVAPATLANDRLPKTLDLGNRAVSGNGRGTWTIRDIVEIRRITDIAIDETTHQIAFIVQESFVDSDQIRYGLYVIDLTRLHVARKLAEAAYLADLSSRPKTDLWTVRGDFGAGTQLYNIGPTGSRHLLVASPDVALIGGYEGVISDPVSSPHRTGILSYQWSPDGSALWYSRLRLYPLPKRKATTDQGIVYDDRSMTFMDVTNNAPAIFAGTELHVRRMLQVTDTLLAFVPRGGAVSDGSIFRDESVWPYWPTSWTVDGRYIQYPVPFLVKQTSAENFGRRDAVRWEVNSASGKAHILASTWGNGADRIPGSDGRGYLQIVSENGTRHLVAKGDNERLLKDYGAVAFRELDSSKIWRNVAHRRLVLGVHFQDTVSPHDGLITLPLRSSALAKITDNLSDCTFTRDVRFGVCVRESLIVAPELVVVSPNSGAVTTLVRPNARLDVIPPLHSIYAHWRNVYGNSNDGYITYPRAYVAGRRYPVIVVTHASGAQNLFADDVGFQWEFPVQVFAERGYLVLSVNEPYTSNLPASAGTLGATMMSVALQQFAENFNPVASMEAALQAAIDSGLADPNKTGIAGYSRGSEITEHAMSESTMFKVGSEGDAGGWEDGGYWLTGSIVVRALYRALYGGSPFDSRALPNYQQFAPAFRAGQFAGPFLQQYASASGSYGLELHTALQDAGIPTEYVLYPHESHIFWDPRQRASAMQRNLDWFDYWLLDKRDNDSSKKEQYERWGAMKNAWKHDSRTTR